MKLTMDAPPRSLVSSEPYAMPFALIISDERNTSGSDLPDL
jgi:hypothetical protein